MHIYIYDSFLSNKKYDSAIAKIETRITDLGLNGKIIRLSLLQSLADSVRDEIRKGAKTIVAVGNNNLLHQCVNAVARAYSSPSLIPTVPVGFIPVGSKNTSIATRIGVPSGVDACNVLSARRIEKLDLGKINNTYFLSEATISTVGSTVNVNDDYSIEISETGKIAIINLSDAFKLPSIYKSSAKDGRLEFCIKTKKSNKFLTIGNKENSTSVFSFTKLLIENKQNKALLLDSVVELDTPATIRLSKKKLNLIVGKGRTF